ncbi:hypothetical protein V1505DRAFT_381784 [Lipomyces doorenjongii]
MPVLNNKFYCPMQCSSGRHRKARYLLGLGYEVSLRTYYRHRNQRRLIGRASLLTADEQLSLFHGSLQIVSSTTNPDRPYNDVECDSQQWQNGQDFEDDVQHNYDNAEGQNYDEDDDEDDEDFADVVTDEEERSDVQSVFSGDDSSGDGELDILDADLDKQDDSNNAVSRMISGTYTRGRPTILTLVIERYGEYSLALIQSHARTRPRWVLAIGCDP